MDGPNGHNGPIARRKFRQDPSAIYLDVLAYISPAGGTFTQVCNKFLGLRQIVKRLIDNIDRQLEIQGQSTIFRPNRCKFTSTRIDLLWPPGPIGSHCWAALKTSGPAGAGKIPPPGPGARGARGRRSIDDSFRGFLYALVVDGACRC